MRVFGNTRRWLASAAMVFCTQLHAGPIEAPPEYLGEYSNVSVSPNSGDCDGFAVKLWSSNKALFGTFSLNEGPCDPIPVPLFAVSRAQGTGHLSFSAPSSQARLHEWMKFDGQFADKSLVGVLKIYSFSGGANKVTGTYQLNLVKKP